MVRFTKDYEQPTSEAHSADFALPFFSGFYESIYESSSHGTDFLYNNDEFADEFFKAQTNLDIQQICDGYWWSNEHSAITKEYHKNCLDAYMHEFQEKLDAGFEHYNLWHKDLDEDALKAPMLKLSFLESPSEYNFNTDVPFVHVESTTRFNQFIHDLWYIANNNEFDTSFKQWIKDNCTSYDGFMSFVSNDLDGEEWATFARCVDNPNKHAKSKHEPMYRFWGYFSVLFEYVMFQFLKEQDTDTAELNLNAYYATSEQDGDYDSWHESGLLNYIENKHNYELTWDKDSGDMEWRLKLNPAAQEV